MTPDEKKKKLQELVLRKERKHETLSEAASAMGMTREELRDLYRGWPMLVFDRMNADFIEASLLESAENTEYGGADRCFEEHYFTEE